MMHYYCSKCGVVATKKKLPRKWHMVQVGAVSCPATKSGCPITHRVEPQIRIVHCDDCWNEHLKATQNHHQPQG